MDKTELASLIDQTLLLPQATATELRKFLENSSSYGFASVCVNPLFVLDAASFFKGAKTKVCTVIDFPLGAGGTTTKLHQAEDAIKNGATELDFVIELALVKEKKWANLTSELRLLAKLSHEGGAIAKLILETCLLSDEEIVQASLCAKEANFDFVKTSTGFSKGGATLSAVSLMRKTVGSTMGVKASGGIHTTQEALAFIKAGASRLGTSAGIAIVDGFSES